MIQLVYILEILKPSGAIRAHFAQAPKAAKRAIQKYGLVGEWQDRSGEDRIVSELFHEGQVLARVVRESVEYA